MNTQAIEKRMKAYYDSATPEQIVKEFEDLGVEFIDIEEQKVKTGLAMLNLFEYMVRNTSDINWKQNLLSQIKGRQDELNEKLNTTTTTDS